jgi:hypothetical protein
VRSSVLSGSTVERVVFACFSPEVERAYRNAGVRS